MSASEPNHPLAEVFGFPTDNFSTQAKRYRKNKLCPYNNKVPSCTKDKANAPLGVCSIHTSDALAITCPIRFRQDWIITDAAAEFFFPESTQWTSLTEVRIKDANGKSAGNIDIVLVAYDDRGHIFDFGALEVQAVYISGNIRRPFEFYLEDPERRHNMDWTKHSRYYPRPDYLSSSRKRLAPQLVYKGGILNAWKKRMAVALHSEFYKTMPKLPKVSRESANLAWLIYDLVYDATQKVYQLTPTKTIYTKFKPALDTIITPEPGPLEDFIETLQDKLDEHLENGNPPDAPSLTDILEV
jgi:hypothetical protein